MRILPPGWCVSWSLSHRVIASLSKHPSTVILWHLRSQGRSPRPEGLWAPAELQAQGDIGNFCFYMVSTTPHKSCPTGLPRSLSFDTQSRGRTACHLLKTPSSNTWIAAGDKDSPFFSGLKKSFPLATAFAGSKSKCVLGTTAWTAERLRSKNEATTLVHQGSFPEAIGKLPQRTISGAGWIL